MAREAGMPLGLNKLRRLCVQKQFDPFSRFDRTRSCDR